MMEHDFIIITDTDEMGDRTKKVQTIYNNWINAPLRPTKYWMTEQDYEDIVKWSKI